MKVCKRAKSTATEFSTEFDLIKPGNLATCLLNDIYIWHMLNIFNLCFDLFILVIQHIFTFPPGLVLKKKSLHVSKLEIDVVQKLMRSQKQIDL